MAVSDENASRVQALNIAGSFFPRRCAKEFRRHPRTWQVIAEEYPVASPRPGPKGSQASAADLIVVNPPGRGAIVCLGVECKKADPRFKEWVFFKKFGGDNRFRHASLALTNPKVEQPIRLLREGNLIDLYDFGRELTGQYTKERQTETPSTKTTSQRIQDAAQQAALTVRSLAHELWTRIPDRKTKALDWATLNQWIHFVPLVLTTAKLLVCDFDAGNVDLQSGEISPESVTFEEKRFVLYDYPATGGLAFWSDDFEDLGKVADSFDAFARMHVLFLQTSALGRLAESQFPLKFLIEGW